MERALAKGCYFGYTSTPLSLLPPTACTTSAPQPDPALALVAFAELQVTEMGPL